jgi:hypothetical protein
MICGKQICLVLHSLHPMMSTVGERVLEILREQCGPPSSEQQLAITNYLKRKELHNLCVQKFGDYSIYIHQGITSFTMNHWHDVPNDLRFRLVNAFGQIRNDEFKRRAKVHRDECRRQKKLWWTKQFRKVKGWMSRAQVISKQ